MGGVFVLLALPITFYEARVIRPRARAPARPPLVFIGDVRMHEEALGIKRKKLLTTAYACVVYAGSDVGGERRLETGGE